MLKLNWLNELRNRFPGTRRRRKSLLAFSERLENRSMLTSFVVTSTEDAPDADPGDGLARTAAGETTLRAAVQEANANPGVDSIEIPAGVLELNIADAGDDSAANGSLDITDDVRLRGAGPGETILDASQIDALFDIDPNVTLRLEDLSLTGQEPLAAGTQTDGGIVELVDVTQTELPAGAAAAELLDPVELFLLGLAQSEFEDEAAQNQEETSDPEVRFPITRIEPLRTNDSHTELLDTLFTPSALTEQLVKPLTEFPLAQPEPVSKPDILHDSGLMPEFELLDTTESTPKNRQLPDGTATEPRKERTATNEPEIPREKTGRREEVINSLFEKPENDRDQVKQTSGEEIDSPAKPTPPSRLPLNPVPLDEDGRLLLEPTRETDRPLPPPLPEPADRSTSAVDAAINPAAAALSIVPARWQVRLRKRLQYWWSVMA